MKLMKLKWLATKNEQVEMYNAHVMGVSLCVIADPDGTYTASLTVPSMRPEFQKGFETAEQARKHAETYMLAREMRKYFVPDMPTNSRIDKWFDTATPKPAADDLCTQIGAMFEEMAELSRAFGIRNEKLEQTAEAFYRAKQTADVTERPIDRVELLDAMCDVQVTMQGVARFMGMNYQGALKEVNRSNWSKFENGAAVRDGYGKIIKGADYTPPELERFADGDK